MKANNFKARIASALMALALLAAPLFTMPASAEGTPTMTVGNASADAGDTVSVDVTISDNPGICSMILGVEYDKTALSLVEVKPAEMGDDIEFGKKIVWINMGGDTNYNGRFVTLVFKVLDDAVIGDKNISITYTDGDICNYDEESVNFTLVDGTISILTGETAAPDAVTDVQNGSGAAGGNAGDNGSGNASDKAQTTSDGMENGEKSSDPENRLPVIIAVVAIVLVAVGTCVFAVVKSKKSGESK